MENLAMCFSHLAHPGVDRMTSVTVGRLYLGCRAVSPRPGSTSVARNWCPHFMLRVFPTVTSRPRMDFGCCVWVRRNVSCLADFAVPVLGAEECDKSRRGSTSSDPF